jgi:hypothetical protein
MALSVVQGSIGFMAAKSERITAYLIRGTEETAWDAIPWAFEQDPRERTLAELAKDSVNALAFVDNDLAAAFIEALPIPESPPPAHRHAKALKEANKRVRAIGLVKLQEETEERSY